jgi:hypothetical protein
VSDFQPSPDYSSDHTVFMVGTGSCLVACSQMFRSADGGATWSYVPAQHLQSTQLILPAASFAGGRFFAAGGNLLQVTNDSGRSFHDYGPLTGYTTAAPAWLGVQVVAADLGLSFIDGSQAPHPVTVFGPGRAAAGPPLLLPAAGGFIALQLVQDDVMGGPDTLLRCTAAGCAEQAQVPLSGDVQLLRSADFDRDHTLVAVGGGVAVSHDAGSSFELVSTAPVFGAIAFPGPSGQRLLAMDTSRAATSDYALTYSDDWGRTWRTAGFDQSIAGALYAHSARALAPGRLIASAADPRHPGMHVFVCSRDGASWSSCSGAWGAKG